MTLRPFAALLVAIAALVAPLGAAGQDSADSLDAQVEAFMRSGRAVWTNDAIPSTDGAIIHDLIVSNGFVSALDIGAGTGHSTVWMAWAVAKTGGRLIAVEGDPVRFEYLRANLEAAGLLDHVDLRLGDAHQIVPELEGPFDFVFSDADKTWYVNYFDAVHPKLVSDACFVAHNVDERGVQAGHGWRAEYYEHVINIPDMQTYLHPDSYAGMAVTCKLLIS